MGNGSAKRNVYMGLILVYFIDGLGWICVREVYMAVELWLEAAGAAFFVSVVEILWMRIYSI